LKTKSVLDHETKSSYSVTVSVSDGALSGSISVTVSVTDVNEAPAFTDGSPSLDVNENTAAGTAFGNPVAATDPRGELADLPALRHGCGVVRHRLRHRPDEN